MRTDEELQKLAAAIRAEDSKPESIDDGGPAFPQGHLDGPHVNPSGMSLRDWFAGQVLIGYASDHRLHEHFGHHAYKVADAMIAARKEPQSEAIT